MNTPSQLLCPTTHAAHVGDVTQDALAEVTEKVNKLKEMLGKPKIR